MSRYCLDTSAYSHFLRGDRAAVETIDRAAWLGMPAVVLGELRAGFLLGTRRQMNEERLAEFLSSPVVEIVDIDDEVSRHFAEIVVDLRRAGRPIPTNDIWIAASALKEGAAVLTYERPFPGDRAPGRGRPTPALSASTPPPPQSPSPRPPAPAGPGGAGG